MAIARIETDGIEDGAVDSSKILDGILGAADIPNDTLTNTKFSNSAAIPTSKLTGLATSATTDTTNATNITSGSLATARVNVGTTAGKILQVDGSGNMPAIDGSQITGVESFTKSASDPTVSTNPSGGVGTEWVNTTSGEIYICTDATAGANVWTNVGAGSGNVPLDENRRTALTKGFVAGGYSQTATIEKMVLASDGNATNVGSLTVSRYYLNGCSSTTYGYNVGDGPPGFTRTIDKHNLTSEGNATNVGDILGVGSELPGTTSSATYGYAHAGYPNTNVIQKFSFSTDGDSTDVGDLLSSYAAVVGITGESYGYAAGGTTGPGNNNNIIQRYSFSSDGNSTDYADLTQSRNGMAGCQSLTHGYSLAGIVAGSPTVNTIDKFPFASAANATDVGDVTSSRSYFCGVSSQTYAYGCGGSTGGSGYVNTIDKVSTTTDGNSTDVGDLTGAKSGPAGTQL